jgi:hypothetical protein
MRGSAMLVGVVAATGCANERIEQLRPRSYSTSCNAYGPNELVGVLAPLESDTLVGVSLQTEDEHCDIRVSSEPAPIDFGALAGPGRSAKFQRRPEFGDYDEWLTSLDNLALADPTGVAYVGGSSDTWSETVFGRRVVRLGDRVARDRDDDWNWSFHAIHFSGDDGSIELLPGEVGQVVIAGHPYWAVALAAVTIDARRRSSVGFCIDYGGWTRKLSYELRRTDVFEEPSPSIPDRDFSEPRCR